MRCRLARHVLAQIVCLGTHSVTSLLTCSGRLARDWTADYRMYSRQRVQPDALFAAVRQHLLDPLPEGAPAVVALDDTRLRKSGRKVSGACYTRDPLGPRFQVNLIWAQRFLQVSLATAAEGQARMIPIAWRHAPHPPKPARQATAQQMQHWRQQRRQHSLAAVACHELARLRCWMDDHGQQQRWLWAVVDGGYTNSTTLKNLPPRTTLVGRIRGDAKLYFLPESSPAKGRPRVYGRRAPTPEQVRNDPSIAWQTVTVIIGGEPHQIRIKTLGPLRWRPAGQHHSLRLIVIAPLRYRAAGEGKYHYRSPGFLITTGTEASAEEIVQRYVYRWDIECNFRDEKTLLGVGEAQVRDPRSVETVTATAVAAYAMLLASSRQLDPNHDFTLPNPRWNRRRYCRPTTRQLIQQMRHDLWAQALHFSSFVSASPQTRSHENSLPHPYHAVLCASRFG